MDTNQCQVCGNFFISLTSLNNHIETHSKKELYHCILGLRNTIAMLSRQPLPQTSYQETIMATDLSQSSMNSLDTQKSAHENNLQKSQIDSQQTTQNSEPMNSPPKPKEVNYVDNRRLSLNSTSPNEGSDNSTLVDSVKEGDVAPPGGENDMLTCPICKRKLTSSYTLYRHMQSHYDKQNDVCQVCGKEFVGKRSLVVHMRTHTGERPYKCPTCGKQFAQYGTLYRHRQIHANKSTETPATVTSSVQMKIPSPKQISSVSSVMDSTDVNQPSTSSAREDRETVTLEQQEATKPAEKTTILSVPSTENLSHDLQTSGESSMYNPHLTDTDAINNLLYQHVFGDQQQFLTGYLQNQLFAQTLARFPNWGSEFALMAGYPGYPSFDYKKPDAEQNFDLTSTTNPPQDKTRIESNIDPPVEAFSDNSVTSSQSERLESFSSLTESLLRRRNQSPIVTTVNATVTSAISTSPSLLTDSVTPNYSHALGIQPPPPSYESAVQHTMNSPVVTPNPVLETETTAVSAVNMSLEFSCKLCPLKFSNSADLTKHASQHTEKNFVWCTICNSKFTTPFSLRRHMKIHTGERDEVCGVCGKRFIDKPRLVVHMRTHTGEKPYACGMCPKTFSRREVLKRHEKTHSPWKPMDFSTPIKEQTLVYTSQDSALSKPEEMSREPDSGMYMSFDEEKTVLSTYFANEQTENTSSDLEKSTESIKYLYTADDIKSDTPTESDTSCHHDDISANQKKDETTLSLNEGESLLPETPVSAYDMSEEQPSGSGIQDPGSDRDQSGSDRDQTGSERSSDRDARAMNEINDMLMRNFTSKVEGAKPYQCDVCNRKYTMQSCLRRHMLVHTGLKPNRCQVCGKSFVEKQQLLVHFRIHTGERPHQCTVCGKRFTQYGTLHNHMQVHRKQQLSHVIGGEKTEEEGGKMQLKRGLVGGVESAGGDQLNGEVDHGAKDSQANEGSAIESASQNGFLSHSSPPPNQECGQEIMYPTREVLSVSQANSEGTQNEKEDERSDQIHENNQEDENVDAQTEKIDNLLATGLKADRPPYDFLYGYPATNLMSLNLLANTSEVHQSLMEHMAQLQRAPEVHQSLMEQMAQLQRAPEVHQSLIEYMAQLQRARIVGLTEFSTAFSRPSVTCTYTSAADIGLNLTTSDSNAKITNPECDLCNQKFPDQTSLETHMKSHVMKNGSESHKNQPNDVTSPTKTDKFHTCKTCGKSFSASFCLRRHEMIHSGNKPYKCEFCPKAFVEKQHLTCHVRIHTGERPYNCKLCGKSFTQYGTLHKHLRTHYKNKPHKCQFCEKAYYERRQLTNHMLTHFDNKGK